MSNRMATTKSPFWILATCFWYRSKRLTISPFLLLSEFIIPKVGDRTLARLCAEVECIIIPTSCTFLRPRGEGLLLSKASWKTKELKKTLSIRERCLLLVTLNSKPRCSIIHVLRFGNVGVTTNDNSFSVFYTLSTGKNILFFIYLFVHIDAAEGSFEGKIIIDSAPVMIIVCLMDKNFAIIYLIFLFYSWKRVLNMVLGLDLIIDINDNSPFRVVVMV